jgi:hypothetical protein
MFPNGTIVDIAIVEGLPAYQAWMMKSVRQTLGNRTSEWLYYPPPVTTNYIPPPGFFQRLVSFIKGLYYNVDTQTPPSSPEDENHTPTVAEQQALQQLLGTLKIDAEKFLGRPVVNIILVFPSLFPSIEREIFISATKNLSLNIISCPDTEHSAYAAAIAQRHAQYHAMALGGQSNISDSHYHSMVLSGRSWNGISGQPNLSDPSACVFGPHGVEDIISIEYTGEIFTLTQFQMFVGSTIYIPNLPPSKYFIAIRTSSSSTNDSASQVTDDEIFWETIRTKIRPTLVEQRTVPHHIMRLLINTPAFINSTHLLHILESTLGPLIPSISHPRGIRIFVLESEARAIYEKQRAHAAAFTCLLTDSSWKDTPLIYERVLHSLINQTAKEADIDMRFAAARGAALLGYEVDGLGGGCAEREVRVREIRVWGSGFLTSPMYMEPLWDEDLQWAL